MRTCSKWVARYRAEGERGLLDRCSAPRPIPHRTAGSGSQVIAPLRRLRMTAAEIAMCLAMPLSTVSAVLTRIGLGKLCRLEPPEPPNRYERARPGELIHIDVKKLGRIRGAGHRVTGSRASQTRNRATAGAPASRAGSSCTSASTTPPAWPTSRCSHDEKATTAVGFLRRAVAFYRRHGITVERVMTDNGSAYRSTIHALACRALGIRHLRTRPYRPRTNGKAERFIRTLLGGWAYGAIYGTSRERTAALDGWLWTYNHRRPHGSNTYASSR